MCVFMHSINILGEQDQYGIGVSTAVNVSRHLSMIHLEMEMYDMLSSLTKTIYPSKHTNFISI